MSAALEPNYQPLQPYQLESTEHEETPQNSGVIIHVVPENNRARWNHIEDLDSFFARMYYYHQKHGFMCMMLQETLELLQFVFVVFFSTFLFHCVDYSILFRDTKAHPELANKKISLSDALIPFSEAKNDFGLVTWVCLLVAAIFWVLRAFKSFYHLIYYWDIKEFFNIALKVDDKDLDNLTWYEVQRRVQEVQQEQQMCIHKTELTELDIYHRILRFKNYTVAMVNKSLLPVKLQVPVVGEVVFLTRGLKYNLELLLFWGPWAPFQNSWHLKEDYKKTAKRLELAKEMSKHILWVGIANLLLSPLILLWQILYSFFNYAEVIKREPGSLGLRSWSLYGRLYLRHFNELDHELNARLNRAYRPAVKYMSIFTSPLMAVIAGNLYFMCGGVFAVLVILTVYDEDVITVEHVLSIMTMLGVIIAICRVFIPDENVVWCPEKLLMTVLADIHYLPDSWKGQAHTNKVHDEFSQLFNFKAIYLLQELISPLVTPFILCFCLRSRSLEIVDFFRNFTVEVVGVGDVCSFAQMDVRRHGNPTWQTSIVSQQSSSGGPGMNIQAEDGKTELSLLHFIFTNPGWKPPEEAQDFVTAFRNEAKKDVDNLELIGVADANPMYSSLNSLSSAGGFNNMFASIMRHNLATNTTGLMDTSLGTMPQFQPPFATSMGHTNALSQSSGEHMSAPAIRGGLSRAEGPLHPLLHTIQQGLPFNSLGASIFGHGGDVIQEVDPLEAMATEMSLSALYLHELHHRQVQRIGHQEGSHNVWQRSYRDVAREQEDKAVYSSQQAEMTPLLDAASRPTRNQH